MVMPKKIQITIFFVVLFVFKVLKDHFQFHLDRLMGGSQLQYHNIFWSVMSKAEWKIRDQSCYYINYRYVFFSAHINFHRA